MFSRKWSVRLLDAADERLRPIAVGEDWGPRCVPNCSATRETKSICIRKETNSNGLCVLPPVPLLSFGAVF